MEAFADAGAAIDDAIEAGEKAYADVTEKIEDYLASTARLKDGRYVMFDEKDGVYRDQNFEVISLEDVAEVEGQTIKPILPYDEMMKWKADVERDLTELRGWSVEIGDAKNQATDDKNPRSQEWLEERTERADELKERAQEKQRTFEQDGAAVGVEKEMEGSFAQPAGATMALPKL